MPTKKKKKVEVSDARGRSLSGSEAIAALAMTAQAVKDNLLVQEDAGYAPLAGREMSLVLRPLPAPVLNFAVKTLRELWNDKDHIAVQKQAPTDWMREKIPADELRQFDAFAGEMNRSRFKSAFRSAALPSLRAPEMIELWNEYGYANVVSWLKPDVSK